MRRHLPARVNVARVSVATSGTDFTAPKADFAALIRAAGFCPGRSHLSRGSCRSWDSAWSAPGAKRTFAESPMSVECHKRISSPNRSPVDAAMRTNDLSRRECALWQGPRYVPEDGSSVSIADMPQQKKGGSRRFRFQRGKCIADHNKSV